MVLCTFTLDRLDFKKLWRAASLRIDFEDENVRRRQGVGGNQTC